MWTRLQIETEVGWPMLDIILLAIAAYSPLFLFKETFLGGRCVHVPVFESTLIGSPSCVSGRYDGLESLREIVHL